MKFKLHWTFGKVEEVEGDNIADACRKAGIGQGAISALDYYEEMKEEENQKVSVSGQSNCGCVYHAEEGMACPHDLEKAGLGKLEE